MGDVPTTGQLALLIAGIAVFIAGGVASLLRLRQEPRDPTGRQTEGLRLAAKACQYCGTFICIGLLIWHSQVRGDYKPLQDNFMRVSLAGHPLDALCRLFTARASAARAGFFHHASRAADPGAGGDFRQSPAA